ncbi:enoyl-CoA hydratase/isomerase family protein [Pseudorhodobacter sp.]|uniref:enoyl-CoA hydratase/isomerase family protein n=1 Tax=Pseudorhodobacter sp. TaxID=1934400 RepID=UPI002AFFBDF2|nr:enoyl-CoA hydratase/isomerase family protein [Pseudorhodobacter sp.]
MIMQHVEITRPEQGLAVVHMKGAGRFNLMSYAMLHELWAAANQIQSEPDIRVVVVTGSETQFSAGMNLKQPEVKGHRDLSIEQRLAIHSIGARACAVWEGLDAVTVCAIEGYCLGGGLAFSAACDFRVAARDTTFGAPELLNGMSMSWQSLPRLVSLIGAARTRKLVMLAENIDAGTAEKWGFVDNLTEPQGALSEAMNIAGRLLKIPAAPLRMTKHAIGTAANALNHAVSFMDLEQYVVSQSTEAHGHALDAFFKGR